MIRQLYNFERGRHFVLACSGGSDSMAIADFYKRGNKDFSIAYFDHGTGNADHVIPLLQKWSATNSVALLIGKIKNERSRNVSPEEHWRNERYDWLHSLNAPFVTCHHANDQVENWLFSSLHGNPKLMKAWLGIGGGIYRPFLTTTKEELVEWCNKHDVVWYEDKSNQDVHYPRNRIRHELMPHALRINPGLVNTIKKKTLRETEQLLHLGFK